MVGYGERLDILIDGKPRSTKHNVIESYAPYIKNSALFLNAGISPTEGEQLVASGKVSAIAFGYL
ncbi:hypothetical protein MPER_00120, partial [Moniliophthora perniciosa FA553]